MLRRSLLLLLAASISSGVKAGAARPASFAPGQIWSVRSVPATTAKVIICRIEAGQGKTVVHVSLIDVPMPPSVLGPSKTTSIGHMPFDEVALATSVDQLLGTNASPAPGFESGYGQWRSASGGVFAISVPEAIKFVFDTLSRSPR